jgi:hypothetical protein
MIQKQGGCMKKFLRWPYLLVVAILITAGITAPGQAHAATLAQIQLTSTTGTLSGYCVNDPGNTTVNGTQLQLQQCSSAASEQLQLESSAYTNGTSNKFYQLVLENGTCLGDYNGGGDGTKVVLWTCNGGGDQAVTYHQYGSGTWPAYWEFSTGYALGDHNNIYANGNPIVVWSVNNSNSEAWNGPSAPAGTVAQRSPYTWPFSWDSIWNIPIASTATYVAAGITSKGTSETDETADYDSTNPSFPVVSLTNARLADGSVGAASVYGDPNMTAGGEWNTCSAFLGTDNSTVYQGQTTELTAGGNPYYGGTSVSNYWAPVAIESQGITGCHGGSGLSGLGGTITLQDLNQSGPITHALKLALDGYLNYSDANGGYRWPATNADGGYNDPSNVNYYGGSNPNVVEGSLLALPPSISPSSFSNPTVQKIATALQDYGAYTVDTTANGQYDNSTIITNYNAYTQLMDDVCGTSCNPDAFQSQLDGLLQDLQVVNNNTASTPGGGSIGASRCAAYAPEFTDGNDAPPNVTVASC